MLYCATMIPGLQCSPDRDNAASHRVGNGEMERTKCLESSGSADLTSSANDMKSMLALLKMKVVAA